MAENKILGKDIPTLTVKESRKVANIIRNEESTESSVSLAVKMGASSKLHFTVDSLSEDLNVVDTSIKSSIKEEVVYTTIFDTEEDKDKIVYTTDEGEISLVRKPSFTVDIRHKAFAIEARQTLNFIISTLVDNKFFGDATLETSVENLKDILAFSKVSFSVDKDIKKRWEDAADKGTLPSSIDCFMKRVEEPVPLFDVLYTVKEGGEE